MFTYALAFKPDDAPAGISGEARLRQLKLVQEFVVKPCLKSVKGVADINTTGGYDQVMVVEVDPLKLPSIGYFMNDIAVLLARDVAVGGGALVETGRQPVPHPFPLAGADQQRARELSPKPAVGAARRTVEYRGQHQPGLQNAARGREQYVTNR